MTPLITAAEAIDLAFDDKNFDTYFIRTTLIEEVQESMLPPILGRDYYSELMAQKQAGTLTAANGAVLDNYLKKAIAYGIKASVIPRVSYRLTSAGISVSKAEQSHPRLSAEIDKAVNDASSSADAWLKAAESFMSADENRADYPTFNGIEPELPVSIGGLIIDRN